MYSPYVSVGRHIVFSFNPNSCRGIQARIFARLGTENMVNESFVGIDVSKQWLDLGWEPAGPGRAAGSRRGGHRGAMRAAGTGAAYFGRAGSYRRTGDAFGQCAGGGRAVGSGGQSAPGTRLRACLWAPGQD